MEVLRGGFNHLDAVVGYDFPKIYSKHCSGLIEIFFFVDKNVKHKRSKFK